MSGLMCLTFCKLDDRSSFRKWARTARLAAKEAGDPLTISWVLAQESYGHYYSGDLQEVPTHICERRSWHLTHRAGRLSCTDATIIPIWAMIRLDRAACLTYVGEMVSGVTYATEKLNALTHPQRQEIIALRGREVLRALSLGGRSGRKLVNSATCSWTLPRTGR